MMRTTMLILTLTFAAILPGADGQIQHHDNLLPEDTTPDGIIDHSFNIVTTPCQFNVVGDTVGYANGIAAVSVVSNLKVAADQEYGAVGLFQGGHEESHDGSTYKVYTILSGASAWADWCDRTIDGLGIEDQF